MQRQHSQACPLACRIVDLLEKRLRIRSLLPGAVDCWPAHCWCKNIFISAGLSTDYPGTHVGVSLHGADLHRIGRAFVAAQERSKTPAIVGIILAFIGIGIAFAGGLSWDNLDRRMLMGDPLGVLAGAAWGATTVVVRASQLSEAPVTLTLFIVLIVGFVGLLLIAAAQRANHPRQPDPRGGGQCAVSGVVVSFFSYLVWFWLLRRYLAANLAVFSFMTPLFGVTFGVVLLGRRIERQLRRRRGIGAVGHYLCQCRAMGARRLRKVLEQH